MPWSCRDFRKNQFPSDSLVGDGLGEGAQVNVEMLRWWQTWERRLAIATGTTVMAGSPPSPVSPVSVLLITQSPVSLIHPSSGESTACLAGPCSIWTIWTPSPPFPSVSTGRFLRGQDSLLWPISPHSKHHRLPMYSRSYTWNADRKGVLPNN